MYIYATRVRLKRKTLSVVVRQLLQAVQPILYGAFIAYLLSPMVDFFEGHLFASAVAKARSAGRISRGARAVSLILTWLVIYVLFHLLASILLKFPYTPLVSVIVGVTNVIPFFGPFLGAIPSIFLILLVNPLQAVYFMLFVLALQQLDGNVIGPKILGDKTGLSSLWVIIAILVGGSFFGVPGMFFGVPVCACLYSAASFFIESRLRKKCLPLSTEAYGASKTVETQESRGPEGGV